ncbi:MAG: outer membrane lipoprotein carrier protein LolA [Flavobacteriaceae bacterium]|nr:outer membrane lipoprotein carrier protein LolA [Flavobacteriaceae bacterium]
MKKTDKMNKIWLFVITLLVNTIAFSQQKDEAVILLDAVSTTMKSYNNMVLDFSTSLTNEEAGIYEGDELPTKGSITLQGEKYNLNYLGNTFIFDGLKLYVINHDEKEVMINDQDLQEDDGVIYPSKLLTFYKEGYEYKMGVIKNIKGRKVQFIDLTPIDTDSEIVKVNLGIDIKTSHIYKLIQFGDNGTKTILTIDQFKSNQNISKEMFQFDQNSYEKLGYLID